MSTNSAISLPFCLLFAFPANSEAAARRAISCNYQRNYTRGCSTQKNLKTVLGELLKSSSQPAAYKTSYAPAPGHTVGEGEGSQNSSATTAIYGLLQCYASTNSNQSDQCSQDAVKFTPASSSPATAAMTWFDDCLVRFDNFNFTSMLDTKDAWNIWNTYHAPDDGAVFDKAAHQLLNNLITKALQP